jgi:hypothetical protein
MPAHLKGALVFSAVCLALYAAFDLLIPESEAPVSR